MTDPVFVYRLHGEDTLAARAGMLEQHLTAPGPGRPAKPVFTALPGGCFRYFDRGRMEQNPTPQLLAKDPEEAMRSALEYMRAVNEAAARYRASRKIDIAKYPDPFAVGSLQRGSAHRVRSRQTGHDDHWLTTWGLRLSASPRPGTPPAVVMGATVEVRVGARGQVVGVVSRVRPWFSVLTRPAYAWKDDHHHDDHQHAHAAPDHEAAPGETAAPPLVYISDNPEEPQKFLAPCYLVVPEGKKHSHNDRHLWPACEHSLLPEILIEQHNGEATAWALRLAPDQKVVAIEHNRGYRLRWSVASLAQFLDGERDTFERTSAPLPGAGLFQVELLVEHIATGAVRSTHVQASVDEAQEEGAPTLA